MSKLHKIGVAAAAVAAVAGTTIAASPASAVLQYKIQVNADNAYSKANCYGNFTNINASAGTLDVTVNGQIAAKNVFNSLSISQSEIYCTIQNSRGEFADWDATKAGSSAQTGIHTIQMSLSDSYTLCTTSVTWTSHGVFSNSNCQTTGA
jgi:hypothetical protein